MAAKKLSYREVMEMAKNYRVDDNILFASAAKRYVELVGTTRSIEKSIKDDGLMIEHTNVKGDVNSDVNPLVIQLPKYHDTANKTLSLMVDIIQKIGTEQKNSRLEAFMDEE